MPTAAEPRTLHIAFPRAGHGGDAREGRFALEVFPGTSDAAVAEAIRVRIGARGGEWFLTRAGGAGAQVPASAALPDGIELAAHVAAAAPPVPHLGATEPTAGGGAAPPGSPIRTGSAGGGVHCPLLQAPPTPSRDMIDALGERETTSATASALERVRSAIHDSDDAPIASPTCPDAWRKWFDSVDTNGDERLEREEIATALRKYPGLASDADSLADALMRRFDLDGNGYIEWKEFQVASETDLSASMKAFNRSTKAFDRFTRVTADLANERTILAWLRTGLAACRTAFAFLGLKAVSETQHVMDFAAGMLMGILSLALLIFGLQRYTRMHTVIGQKDPPVYRVREGCWAWVLPHHWGRWPVVPLYLVFVAIAAVTAMCITTKTFHKNPDTPD